MPKRSLSICRQTELHLSGSQTAQGTYRRGDARSELTCKNCQGGPLSAACLWFCRPTPTWGRGSGHLLRALAKGGPKGVQHHGQRPASPGNSCIFSWSWAPSPCRFPEFSALLLRRWVTVSLSCETVPRWGPSQAPSLQHSGKCPRCWCPGSLQPPCSEASVTHTADWPHTPDGATPWLPATAGKAHISCHFTPLSVRNVQDYLLQTPHAEKADQSEVTKINMV